MRFLANLLDDPSDEPCGVCDNCTSISASRDLPLGLIAEAEAFLRRRPIVIRPRKRRYDAGRDTTTMIPTDEQLAEGRVLSIWGDAGWGQLARDGKQRDEHFDDKLVEALAELVRDWQPDPAPEWVAAVPSRRHPDLVRSLAERVASRLGLPCHAVVEKVADRPRQKAQQNSMHQQRNVAGAFVVGAPVPQAPVLLVDDVFDSGWTLTEVGRLLRRAGATVVYPVALASSAGRD